MILWLKQANRVWTPLHFSSFLCFLIPSSSPVTVLICLPSLTYFFLLFFFGFIHWASSTILLFFISLLSYAYPFLFPPESFKLCLLGLVFCDSSWHTKFFAYLRKQWTFFFEGFFSFCLGAEIDLEVTSMYLFLGLLWR